jgi:GntR family transcriptional regulator, rspAB operon transcriptional repressor
MATKTTQTERAYALMKKGILCGEIKEGFFLSEAVIAKQYDIGRTPFREACNRLHHEGLLEVVPRRGYLVPETSFKAMRDLFEMRLIFETKIAELAAVRACPSEVAELDRLAKRPLPSRPTLNDFEQIIKTNTDFHLQLASICQNRELVKMLTSILERMQRPMYLELRSSILQPTAAIMVHEPIVKAIRERNPVAAREAVIQDITQAQSLAFRVGVGISAVVNSESVRRANSISR